MSDPTRKSGRPLRRSSALGALALAAALTATLFLSPPGTAAQGAPPGREAAPQGQTSLRAADPSVLRVGSTYVGVQSTGGGIVVRQASSTDGLATAPARQVWADSRGRGEVWAPEIVNTSPPAGPRFPSMYHAVAKGTPYSWANRHWYTGTFVWWGDTTYSRANVPGPTSDKGWSLKFFE